MLVICGNPWLSDFGGWKSGQNKGSSIKQSKPPANQQYIQCTRNGYDTDKMFHRNGQRCKSEYLKKC